MRQSVSPCSSDHTHNRRLPPPPLIANDLKDTL
jgi:hypothetical protein